MFERAIENDLHLETLIVLHGFVNTSGTNTAVAMNGQRKAMENAQAKIDILIFFKENYEWLTSRKSMGYVIGALKAPSTVRCCNFDR